MFDNKRAVFLNQEDMSLLKQMRFQETFQIPMSKRHGQQNNEKQTGSPSKQVTESNVESDHMMKPISETVESSYKKGNATFKNNL